MTQQKKKKETTTLPPCPDCGHLLDWRHVSRVWACTSNLCDFRAHRLFPLKRVDE
jgi:ribosomal protein L37AE/L43A